MIKERILLVDDEEDLLTGLKRTILRELDNVEVLITTSAIEAISLIGRESVDIALLDIRMPEMDGLELLKKLRQEDSLLTAIMMTAFGSIELAVDAMRGGAYDFITKPIDKGLLFRVIRKGLERNQLLRENRSLKRRICTKEAFANFIGQSYPMRSFYKSLETIASADYTVLIRGESGTGKEIAARILHRLSKRRNHPLIMVNCPATPEHLLESELFGHKRGAFTGADRDHPGLFEEADGGTICLDEIGDIPMAIQSKLLRVLQEQEIKPLGSTSTRRIDVRIIASTNQDLEKKITEHTFRDDLFYRLNVVCLRTPSLDEIRGDIPLLVKHFTRQVCCELELPEKCFSRETIERLMARDWPGNVRELQNLVRRVVMFCAAEIIEVADLITPGDSTREGTTAGSNTQGSGETEPYKNAKERLIRDFTGQYITNLLKKTNGNVTRAAKLSGLSRTALQKIIQRTAIKSTRYRLDHRT